MKRSLFVLHATALAFFGLVVTGFLSSSAFGIENLYWHPGDQCTTYVPAKSNTITPTVYGPRNDDSTAQWWRCPTEDNYWGQNLLSSDVFQCVAVGYAPAGEHLVGLTRVMNIDGGHSAISANVSSTNTGPSFPYEVLAVGGDGSATYGFNDIAYRKVLFIYVPPGGYVYAYGCIIID